MICRYSIVHVCYFSGEAVVKIQAHTKQAVHKILLGTAVTVHTVQTNKKKKKEKKKTPGQCPRSVVIRSLSM
jgi:hypothetical protein